MWRNTKLKYHVLEFLRDYKPQENKCQIERYGGKDIDSYLKSTPEKILPKKLKLNVVRGDK